MTLAESVRHSALCAALRDPRFQPLALEELADVHVEVSILTLPHAMQNLDELVLGRHGVLVRRGPQRGLFLPQVATDHHFDRETFLSRCCSEKAGLSPDAWRDPATEVLLFETDVSCDPPAD